MHTHTHMNKQTSPRKRHKESIIQLGNNTHTQKHTNPAISSRVSQIVTHGTSHCSCWNRTHSHKHAHLTKTVSQIVILDEQVVRLWNRTCAHTPFTHTHTVSHLNRLLQGSVANRMRTLSNSYAADAHTQHTNTQTSPRKCHKVSRVIRQLWNTRRQTPEHTSFIIMRVPQTVTHGTCHTPLEEHAFTHTHEHTRLTKTVSQSVILDESVCTPTPLTCTLV